MLGGVRGGGSSRGGDVVSCTCGVGSLGDET